MQNLNTIPTLIEYGIKETASKVNKWILILQVMK